MPLFISRSPSVAGALPARPQGVSGSNQPPLANSSRILRVAMVPIQGAAAPSSSAQTRTGTPQTAATGRTLGQRSVQTGVPPRRLATAKQWAQAMPLINTLCGESGRHRSPEKARRIQETCTRGIIRHLGGQHMAPRDFQSVLEHLTAFAKVGVNHYQNARAPAPLAPGLVLDTIDAMALAMGGASMPQAHKEELIRMVSQLDIETTLHQRCHEAICHSVGVGPEAYPLESKDAQDSTPLLSIHTQLRQQQMVRTTPGVSTQAAKSQIQQLQGLKDDALSRGGYKGQSLARSIDTAIQRASFEAGLSARAAKPADVGPADMTHLGLPPVPDSFKPER